jgi:hypothetical protein
MGGTWPLLESGSICKYPVTRRSGWLTRVNCFVDFSEQRWVVRQPLVEFIFKYRNVSRADVAALRVFFETQLGAYDTFVVEFDGITYQDMVFDQDNFSPVEEQEPNRFSLEFKLKQTRPNGWFQAPVDRVLDTPAYPFIGDPATISITHGVITQRPWTGTETYFTNKIDLESGTRYSYAWLPTPLRRWELNYPTITEADAVTIENFFQAMHGRMYHFYFHDPELFLLARKSPFSWAAPDPNYQPISNCRFDMDQIEIQYVQPGQWTTKVFVAEYVPSNFDGLPS